MRGIGIGKAVTEGSDDFDLVITRHLGQRSCAATNHLVQNPDLTGIGPVKTEGTTESGGLKEGDANVHELAGHSPSGRLGGRQYQQAIVPDHPVMLQNPDALDLHPAECADFALAGQALGKRTGAGPFSGCLPPDS